MTPRRARAKLSAGLRATKGQLPEPNNHTARAAASGAIGERHCHCDPAITRLFADAKLLQAWNRRNCGRCIGVGHVRLPSCDSIKRYFSILHGGPRSVRRVAHRFLADHAGDRDEVRAELQQLVGPGEPLSDPAQHHPLDAGAGSASSLDVLKCGLVPYFTKDPKKARKPSMRGRKQSSSRGCFERVCATPLLGARFYLLRVA